MNDLKEKAYIFGMIFMLSNKLQILGDKTDPLLTVKQWLLLAGVLRCESNAPTLSEIAAQIGSSRQNVKKTASILARAGYVLMNKDADDARVLRISLTNTCLEHLKKRDKMEQRFLEKLFAGFAPEELSLLSQAIQKLEENLTGLEQSYEEVEA
ncbi:MAG: MarR family transcriptional regulator [Clostridia bacterium]|jgi:DNA-binding MarR family transcriptional regulator|nr:MarR family transcriptional regulator [Clostridia bacterium]